MKPCLTPLALVVLSATVAYGQGAGTIVGTVTDATGAVIPGATVTARQTATRLERSTASTSEGYFVLASLPPSTYDLEVKITGFETFLQRGIVLQADQSLT